MAGGRIEQLRDLGLSSYQASTYVAMLQLGRAEAREISRLSKVPLAKIYQTLQQLQERGLALVYPENPRSYAPVPFDTYLERRCKEHETEIAALTRLRETSAQAFAITGGESADDRGEVNVVRGRPAVLGELDDVIHAATRDLLIIASAGYSTQEAFAQLEPLLLTASERGVQVRVLLQGDATAPGAPYKLARVASRPALAGTLMAFADSARGLVVHFVPDDGDTQRGNDIALHLTQQGLIVAMRALAEREWEIATHPLSRSRTGLTHTNSGAILEHIRLAGELRASTATSMRLVEQVRARLDAARGGGSDRSEASRVPASAR